MEGSIHIVNLARSTMMHILSRCIPQLHTFMNVHEQKFSHICTGPRSLARSLWQTDEQVRQRLAGAWLLLLALYCSQTAIIARHEPPPANLRFGLGVCLAVGGVGVQRRHLLASGVRFTLTEDGIEKSDTGADGVEHRPTPISVRELNGREEEKPDANAGSAAGIDGAGEGAGVADVRKPWKKKQTGAGKKAKRDGRSSGSDSSGARQSRGKQAKKPVAGGGTAKENQQEWDEMWERRKAAGLVKNRQTEEGLKRYVEEVRATKLQEKAINDARNLQRAGLGGAPPTQPWEHTIQVPTPAQ
eukprot:SAG11_NODE_1431_length_4937_cov_1.954940_8_plen_301_part_00